MLKAVPSSAVSTAEEEWQEDQTIKTSKFLFSKHIHAIYIWVKAIWVVREMLLRNILDEVSKFEEHTAFIKEDLFLASQIVPCNSFLSLILAHSDHMTSSKQVDTLICHTTSVCAINLFSNYTKQGFPYNSDWGVFIFFYLFKM